MNSPITRIVCLANSRKLSGRCIAGKELMAGGRIGGWIRPVSARPNEEVSESERQYENGDEPRLLDIIDVPLLRMTPTGYQQENWLLDPSRRWERVQRFDVSALDQLVDPIDVLWMDGHSSGSGSNDRIPLDDTISLNDSLRMIKVEALQVTVSPPDREGGSPVLRGSFRYSTSDYSLRITDPEVEMRAAQLAYRDYTVGERCLTISLGEPFQGYTYKLIAGIIRLVDEHAGEAS